MVDSNTVENLIVGNSLKRTPKSGQNRFFHKILATQPPLGEQLSLAEQTAH